MIEEFPLFVFTTLGGIAAGAYILGAFFNPDKEVIAGKRGWLLPLICLVLLAISGITLLTHLGHPERFLNAFSNPTAGITLEGYTMGAFGVIALIDMIIGFTGKESPKWLRIIGAVFAACMIAAMAYAYYTSYGVLAWSSWQTILLFVFGNCSMGFTLALALGYRDKSGNSASIVTIIVEALAALGIFCEAFYFAALGLGFAPFVIGGIIVVIALVINCLGISRNSIGLYWVAFCCAVIGVAIARYAFYAAFML